MDDQNGENDDVEELEGGRIRKFVPLNPIQEGRKQLKEEIEKAQETLDFNKPDFTFTAKTTHNWKQRGYYLHCTSCDLQHGVFVGADRILTGINDAGEPILQARSQLNMA